MGLVLGRVRERTRAPWQALSRASSIGSMPACMSMKLFGDVLRTPVIASAAMCWAFWKFHRAPAEPMFLVWPGSLDGRGVPDVDTISDLR